MDIMPLVLGSIFLLVLFVANIFLVFAVRRNTRKDYEDVKKDVYILDQKVKILTTSYSEDVRNILRNIAELIKIVKK